MLYFLCALLCALLKFSVQAPLGECKYERLPDLQPVNFTQANAVRSEVLYVLFNGENDEGVYLTEETVATATFDRTLQTKFLIHGWTQDMTTSWYAPLKAAFFQKGEFNIFYVDYGKAASLTFEVSAANVDPVGEFVADFVIASGIPLENVHLIGHSLGGQLVGFIGKHALTRTGQRIGRITALDPAGPCFVLTDVTLRLNSTDADFVDVIHVDGGYFGLTEPVGLVDFYPNGGHCQPGCPLHLEDDSCSHHRSTLYFIESVNTEVAAVEAVFDSNDGTVTAVEGGAEIVFGDDVSSSDRGVYYLTTRASSPFLIESVLYS